MPSTLPPSSNYTGTGATQGEKKTFIAAMRTWLSEAFGTDSTPATVLAALGGLAKAGGAMTGLLKFAKGADIASAPTVDLTAATGNTVLITGTTGITTFTMTSGQRMSLIFDGILTLTHHATNLKIQGGLNIVTAAGATCDVYYHGTTVYLTNYAGTNAQAAARVGKNNGSVTPGNVVLFNDVQLNRGSCYSAATGRFTATEAGDFLVVYTGFAAAASTSVNIRKNGTDVVQAYGAGVSNPMAASLVIDLAAGDYIDAFCFAGTVYGSGSINALLCITKVN